jgi:hypothetical protein
MNAEYLTADATLATVVVIGASAIAALVQLRHMRASNQLQAVLSLESDFRSPEVQASLHYIQERLPQRLEDPDYRQELALIGYISIERHPELIACNWFTQMGTFLKHGLISEDMFMDLFARLIRYYWRALAPVVAIMRRSRGPSQYDEFEYLALRAIAWLDAHPQGEFPRGMKRESLPDPWVETDVPQGPTGPGLPTD